MHGAEIKTGETAAAASPLFKADMVTLAVTA
jgi:hypothetical protein